MTDVTFQVFPDGKLQGRVRVAGDKSISHRSIMLGAIAEGETYISGFLQGEDTLATLAAFQAMGVNIQRNQDVVKIQGVGLHGLKKPDQELYLGNSGTSMRLLSGLLSAQSFDTILTGDPSLSKRPMRRVTDPLSKMGAKIISTENGTPPLQIFGNQKLQGIEYVMPMASAQVKSSILLAGLYADGTTCVIEPAPTRDHSERMLQGFGYEIQRHGAKVCLKGGGKLFAKNIDVPADISSAAFFIVGAIISINSELYIEHVGINPTRTGILDILNLMGANIQLLNKRDIGGEPVADLLVKSSTLKGIQIPEALVPLAIDEFPAIFIAAACADGETVLTGAEELRVKESDRIQVMADGLKALGINALPTPAGMIIRGGQFDGGEIDSHGDHRIAMSFAMASLRAKNPIKIKDCANVATSFPNFVDLALSLGLNIEQH
jgi:3-phosphoshikimate 1-carboxyvinyltransferase